MLAWLGWIVSGAVAAPQAEVEAVLDSLHRAAHEADAGTYFGLFAEEAVFIGTDPDERWPLQAFRAFAEPHFAEAPAWSYTPVSRTVSFGPRSRTAWFDEVLRHERYGDVRGSGVLVREGRDWRISQYVLSFAIPNGVAMHVLDVRKGEAMLPPPYTAAQIRDAMPEGLVVRHRHRRGDQEHETTWHVIEAHEGGLTMGYGTPAAPDAEKAEHTWADLRDHAAFPAAQTTWAEERIDTALGPLDCRRYEVLGRDDDGPLVQRFWFCPAVAGAPVRLRVHRGDAVVSEMELVAHSVYGVKGMSSP